MLVSTTAISLVAFDIFLWVSLYYFNLWGHRDMWSILSIWEHVSENLSWETCATMKTCTFHSYSFKWRNKSRYTCTQGWYSKVQDCITLRFSPDLWSCTECIWVFTSLQVYNFHHCFKVFIGNFSCISSFCYFCQINVLAQDFYSVTSFWHHSPKHWGSVHSVL